MIHKSMFVLHKFVHNHSKLTTSLVNGTLDFQTYCTQKHSHLLPKNVKSTAKAFLNFSAKNISILVCVLEDLKDQSLMTSLSY